MCLKCFLIEWRILEGGFLYPRASGLAPSPGPRARLARDLQSSTEKPPRAGGWALAARDGGCGKHSRPGLRPLPQLPWRVTAPLSGCCRARAALATSPQEQGAGAASQPPPLRVQVLGQPPQMSTNPVALNNRSAGVQSPKSGCQLLLVALGVPVPASPLPLAPSARGPVSCLSPGRAPAMDAHPGNIVWSAHHVLH